MSHIRRLMPDFFFVAFLVVLAMVLGALADSVARGSDELGDVRPCVAGHCVCDSNRVHSVDRAKFVMGCTETAQHPDCPDNILSQLCTVLPFSANLRSMLNSIPHVASRGIPSKIGYVAIQRVSVVMAAVHSIGACTNEVFKNEMMDVFPYSFAINAKSHDEISIRARSLGCHWLPCVGYKPPKTVRVGYSPFLLARPHRSI